MKLFRYQLGNRSGLILQLGENFGEIAPLPGFSKENLIEAEKEVLAWMHKNTPPTLPSVQWGIACAHKPLQSVNLPLSALGPKDEFPTKKLKLGHLSVADAVSFVKKQKGNLRLDCNRKWSLSQAIEFTSHFKPTDFVYIEEPTEDVATFSKMTGFPVAVDESIGTDWSQIPTLKAVVVKPSIVGYIPKVPPQYDLILSSSYESGIGLLHIANAAQNALPIGLDTVFENDILKSSILARNGYFKWEKSHPIVDLEKLCPVL